MKILVAVKRVVDYNVKVRINADNTDVDLSNAKMLAALTGLPQDTFMSKIKFVDGKVKAVVRPRPNQYAHQQVSKSVYF